MQDKFSSQEYLEKLNKYWNATNYLSVAQLYLLNNPLMRDHKLCEKDIKRKIVGHWGTVPGQNFVYAHCNRAICKYDLDMILVSGPGHGGNFLTANSYLEGVYSSVYPNISQDKEGMTRLCKQFSFPGGIGSHCVPETPGSIHEGGELGYSLAHSFGAVLDNPNLIVACVVGDGEAETGPLATSWFGNKFINPKTDGTVLPILHMNGFKISNPTILSRLSDNDIISLFDGYGYRPYFVAGSDPMDMHNKMAFAMDRAIEDIQQIKKTAGAVQTQIKWPMIILKTPKGWTGPKIVDGKQIENSFRAHQVPISMSSPEHLQLLQTWLESYHPEELFDENYKLKKEIADILPKGNKRMSASPYVNGGVLLKDLKTPPIENYAVKFTGHGTVKAQDMLELGGYVRDLFRLNDKNKNYRIFSPDEAMSNRLYKVFESENRAFCERIYGNDEFLAPTGRIHDSFLSEHLCEGMLEGYLLTGRHGMFDSYEAFIRVVDSMVAQHAKWLKVAKEVPWRAPISSLNLILTSNVWQQDHNGFTHQDPGFLDHIVAKKADIVRLYLPADANCLLSCFDHATKSKNYINVIVASKHPTYQWLSMEEAKEHCAKGVGEWKWAGMNNTKNPDLVVVSCGDTATIESLATISLLKKFLPKLNVRFVNVVDLMKLVPNTEHPHGLSGKEYNDLFTKDKPILFNFHGYAKLIRQLTYSRENRNMAISGYNEEGTITTAFDIRQMNKTDRYHQLLQAVEMLKLPKTKAKEISDFANLKLKQNHDYIREYGVDMPEIADWNFNAETKIS